MNNFEQLEHVSVSDYLETINDGLKNFDARVLGEVTEVQLYPGRTYLFFKVKDKEDEALMTCFMWKRDYTLSGVDLEPGLEIIVSGFPEIYKPSGRFSFRARAVEHVGEGKLKKAYDELKARLEKEGLFSPTRKRPLPNLPQKIGLITSKDGAVIGDFQVNLGNFGFKVLFVDSRVEGQLAVSELLGAIRTFKKQDIEILVLVRGGGSLESLLPFNNEALVREVASFPVPVLVGVGHEKDVPLIALVADKTVSTPTATAQALNESWQRAATQVQLNQQKMHSSFAKALNASRTTVERSFQLMRDQFQSIFNDFNQAEQALLRIGTTLKSRIAELLRQLNQYPIVFVRGARVLLRNAQTYVSTALENPLHQLEYAIRTATEGTEFGGTVRVLTHAVSRAKQSLVSAEKLLGSNNPERQLRLGYSIVQSRGAVVRRVSQVRKGQSVDVRLQDGSFKSDVTDITKKV
ncbi:MAG TPA: exodeoxyribonuclease VII large subunit [Candidatus Paceibacterota bacterium]